ncbi:hypothetical protein VNI00_017949 [Paramarasmius palmivorus]|uniref:Uncharacterized protein n=1 Tax=Paramarasmius palmivorus TaxID=297713 RepID=A0AAW0B2B5_9AGAR
MSSLADESERVDRPISANPSLSSVSESSSPLLRDNDERASPSSLESGRLSPPPCAQPRCLATRSFPESSISDASTNTSPQPDDSDILPNNSRKQRQRFAAAEAAARSGGTIIPLVPSRSSNSGPNHSLRQLRRLAARRVPLLSHTSTPIIPDCEPTNIPSNSLERMERRVLSVSNTLEAAPEHTLSQRRRLFSEAAMRRRDRNSRHTPPDPFAPIVLPTLVHVEHVQISGPSSSPYRVPVTLSEGVVDNDVSSPPRLPSSPIEIVAQSSFPASRGAPTEGP